MRNIIFIITIIFFFIISCKRDDCKKMPEQIIGTGEIINNAIVRDISRIPKTDYIITSDSLNVFNIPALSSDSIIVINLTVSFNNGTTYQPIDFSQYTILGKYAEAGGCKVVFDRNVTKNIENKKYIYKITIIHCGYCEDGFSDMNWVLVMSFKLYI